MGDIPKIRMTWRTYELYCNELLNQIVAVGKKYDGILAISRGGLPVGVYLSHHLNIPLFMVAVKTYEGTEKTDIDK